MQSKQKNQHAKASKKSEVVFLQAIVKQEMEGNLFQINSVTCHMLTANAKLLNIETILDAGFIN